MNLKHFLIVIITIGLTLSSIKTHTKNIINYQTPDQLKKKLNLHIPKEGGGVKKVLNLIDLYQDYSVNTSSKQFFNQLFSAPSPIGVLGEVIATITQTSMYTFEMAPVATLMEQEVIKKLTQMIGFKNGEGLFVTGGSNANLMALFAARNHMMPTAKQNGLECGNKLACFVSDQAHYSFAKAANVIGIGMKNVIPIRSDKNGCMSIQALDRAIIDAKKNNLIPFFIAGTAGTTVRGAFDQLKEISVIAKKHNLWLHVDAAYGGSVMFSPQYKYLVDGIDQADSVTWDFHKVMGIPLICSVILINKPGTLYKLNALDDHGYLFHNDNSYNLGHLSLQCGRRVDVLKLWLDWSYHGDSGYAKRIEKLFDLAAYATKKVKLCKNLKLIGPQHYLNICFQYIPESLSYSKQDDIRAINELTVKVRNLMLQSDKSMVNYGTIGKRTCIRLVITNPAVTYNDVDIFFDTIQMCAKQLKKKERV